MLRRKGQGERKTRTIDLSFHTLHPILKRSLLGRHCTLGKLWRIRVFESVHDALFAGFQRCNLASDIPQVSIERMSLWMSCIRRHASIRTGCSLAGIAFDGWHNTLHKSNCGWRLGTTRMLSPRHVADNRADGRPRSQIWNRLPRPRVPSSLQRRTGGATLPARWRRT